MTEQIAIRYKIQHLVLKKVNTKLFRTFLMSDIQAIMKFEFLPNEMFSIFEYIRNFLFIRSTEQSF